MHSGAPQRQVHTTLCKQLALYVTLIAPLQMAADLPENYEAKPDAFASSDVPVDWDDTKICEAEPGDYITIARKQKNSTNWFIGVITDESSRTATIPLSFLNSNQAYMATIYADGKGADWKNNPEAYQINQYIVTTLPHYVLLGGRRWCSRHCTRRCRTGEEVGESINRRCKIQEIC